MQCCSIGWTVCRIIERSLLNMHSLFNKRSNILSRISLEIIWQYNNSSQVIDLIVNSHKGMFNSFVYLLSDCTWECMRHLDKFVANARVAENNGWHCWFPKVEFLVIKSLYVMKPNSELWVLRAKLIYAYPRCTCMIVNRDSYIEILIAKERPNLNQIDAHDNCMSEGKICIH